MAAPTNLYFLNKNYTMIPDDGEGPLVHVKYGSYIIPVRWGNNSEKFEEELLALIDKYLFYKRVHSSDLI